MFHSLFASSHLLGYLDLAVIFVVTAGALYLNDHLPQILRHHRHFHQFIRTAVHSEFYWPVMTMVVGGLMLLFVVAQMAISSLFVLGYGLWLIHRARALIPA